MTWIDAPIQQRPLVVVEDHLYHTAELVAALGRARPDLVAQTTAIAIDKPGPDTEAAVADCRRRWPELQVVAVAPAEDRTGTLGLSDLEDPTSLARVVARHLRPGGVLVQDVHLSTLPFVPAERWWESIYLAATIRGLFADRPPLVRFLSNKRGYAATFGRDLLDAGFDPRDVMDKAALGEAVVPTLVRLLDAAFPMRLTARVSGARRTWPASPHASERDALAARLDLLLWQGPNGHDLAGRLVAVPPAARVVTLRAGSPEIATWRSLIDDVLGAGKGLPVLALGERVGPADMDRAEATNVAARHIHGLRARLTDSGAIVTADHAYRLRDHLDIGICERAVAAGPPSAAASV